MWRPKCQKFILNIHGNFCKEQGFLSPGKILTHWYPKNMRFADEIIFPSKWLANKISSSKNVVTQEVTCAEAYQWTQGEWQPGKGYSKIDNPEFHVVAYDFGVKHNILRMLAERGCKLTVVPAKTSAEAVLALNPDGIFLSNGPGDPEPCDYAIQAIQTLLQSQKPLFGICLGHQLLGLAVGGKTKKMSFGHHGANHPVQDLASQKVLITSQNHGFEVDEHSLPKNVRITHRSLFDNSVQGIELIDQPAFSFQGHPEASPGPNDVAYLFDKFIAQMRAAK